MSNQDADYGRPTCPTCGLTLSMFDPPQEHDHDAESVAPVAVVRRMMDALVRKGNCGCHRCLAEAAIEGLREAGYEIKRHSDGSTRNEENR